MAEVVSKGQVKGAYFRATAKVHPGKVSVAHQGDVDQLMYAR